MFDFLQRVWQIEATKHYKREIERPKLAVWQENNYEKLILELKFSTELSHNGLG